MATVQMPDGQLVELPDNPDDDEKERIRQTFEALKQKQAQPQGGSPTPTPSPPSVAPVERTGETGFVFAPRSGTQMEDLEARQFLETPQSREAGLPRGTGDQPVIPIPRIPQQQGIAAQLGAGAVNIGSGLVEMTETPQALSVLPVAGSRLAQALFAGQTLSDIRSAYEEASQPGTSIQKGLELGGRALIDAVFGVGMAKGAAGEIAPKVKPVTTDVGGLEPISPDRPANAYNIAVSTPGSVEPLQPLVTDPFHRAAFETPELRDRRILQESKLSTALNPIFKKHEPISETPLSDAATKEVSDASKVTSTEGIPSEQIRPAVDEETSLRQQGETAGARQTENVPLEVGEPNAASSGGAGSAEGNVGLPADVTAPETAAPVQTEPSPAHTVEYKSGDQGTERLVTVRDSTGRIIGQRDPFYPQGIPVSEAARNARIQKVASEIINEHQQRRATNLGAKRTPQVISDAGENVWDQLKGVTDRFETSGIDVTDLSPADRRELAGRGLSLSEDRNGRVIANPTEKLVTENLQRKATAPKLLPGELQGDLLSSTQSEPLKLVGEQFVDHEATALEEKGKAEGRAKSEEGQTTFADLGNVRDIPEDATVRVKLKNTAGEPIEIPMNAREAEGIFRKERSSYDALIDCLSR